MIVFQGAEKWGRLDWNILKNGPVALYHRPEILAEDVEWLRQHQYGVHEFDCSTYSSKEEFLCAIGRSLGFPDRFSGRSLDAFHDWLAGLDLPEGGGTVLVLHKFDRFEAGFPELAWKILDIVARDAWLFLLQGHWLLTLIQLEDRTRMFQYPMHPVGGQAPFPNPREVRELL